MVHPRVYAAMGQPVVGHLDPFFFQTSEEIRKLLGYAYSTKNEFNMAISGTGSSGMEACVASFAEPGKKFALLSNGFFAERLGEMARRQGADVVKLEKQWGQPFDPQEAREFIKREKPSVVGFVQAETSTGMYNQAKPITEAAHEVDAVVIGDCVTSLGAMPVLLDENGIDIPYSCTQKGLGLSSRPVAGDCRAARAGAPARPQVDHPHLVISVPQLLDSYYSGHRYHHTASATMFYALREGAGDRPRRRPRDSLGAASQEPHRLREKCREARLTNAVADPANPLWTLNTPRIPEGVDDAKVRQYLLEQRGIEIAAASVRFRQGVRIGLMGYGSTASAPWSLKRSREP